MYVANKPLATDKLRVSQADINANFQALDSVFDVDHVKYSDSTGDAGKHAATTFVNRTDKVLTIPPVTTAQEFAVYVKDDAAGTPQIFYQEPDSAGAGVEIQITGPLIDGTTGECALPGGLGLKWGLVTTIANGAGVAYTYAGLGLNAFTSDTYSFTANPLIRIESCISVIAKSATGFTLAHAAGVVTLSSYWVAIGK